MKLQNLLGLGLVAAVVASTVTIAAHAEGTISFYKQPGGTHTKLCTLSDSKTQRYNLKTPHNKPCSNDEANSAILENVKTGTVVRLYDNQWGHKTDGWGEITVKQPHSHYVVTSFQGNYEDDYVKVEYHNDTNFMGWHGLNDQISRIEIDEPLSNF
jgi:hypothetical protein